MSRMISIHALLAESDVPGNIVLTNVLLFLSTLSLRRATDEFIGENHERPIFLSTLSLRRATRAGWQPWTVRRYFYPRSPCGERLPD